MIKFSYSPYSLMPIANLNAASGNAERSGVLFKMEWPDGLIGYSDLHPWPELGDETLEKQLAGLKRGRLSSQIEQSIWLARRDAVARKEKRNLLDSTIRLKNNYVIPNIDSVDSSLFEELRKAGFTQLKLKVGRDLDREKDFLTRVAAAGFKVRLDFNATGNWQIFEKFFARVPRSVFPSIDYVEDPFPFDAISWQEARKLVKIAIDNQYSQVNWSTLRITPFDVVVIKPAKMDVEKVLGYCFQHKIQATITSYMDHPVGLVHALAVATDYKKTFGDLLLNPGCLTHRLYKMESFAAELQTQGPYIVKAPGYGVGFDKLLESLTWQPLKIR